MKVEASLGGQVCVAWSFFTIVSRANEAPWCVHDSPTTIKRPHSYFATCGPSLDKILADSPLFFRLRFAITDGDPISACVPCILKLLAGE